MYNIFMLYMEKGGVINILISIVCFIVVYVGIGKWLLFYSLGRPRRVMEKFVKCKYPESNPDDFKKDWLIYRFLNDWRRKPNISKKYFYNRFREMLLEKIPLYEEGLETMAAWTAVAPLLGLFGTVVGMVKTFSIITIFGVGNPGLLSEGISIALFTTQSGLVVAFPCLLFHNHLVSRKNILVKELIRDSEKILGWIDRRER